MWQNLWKIIWGSSLSAWETKSFGVRVLVLSIGILSYKPMAVSLRFDFVLNKNQLHHRSLNFFIDHQTPINHYVTYNWSLHHLQIFITSITNNISKFYLTRPMLKIFIDLHTWSPKLFISHLNFFFDYPKHIHQSPKNTDTLLIQFTPSNELFYLYLYASKSFFNLF